MMRHDHIPPLNFLSRIKPAQFNRANMAKLSRLVLRAQLTRRATFGTAVNIRSAMQFSYAMAGSRNSRIIETARFGERGIRPVAQAGLSISQDCEKGPDRVPQGRARRLALLSSRAGGDCRPSISSGSLAPTWREGRGSLRRFSRLQPKLWSRAAFGARQCAGLEVLRA